MTDFFEIPRFYTYRGISVEIEASFI